MSRRTWSAFESGRLLERSTKARQVGLMAVLAVVVLFALLGGCTSTPQEWCDDNPVACRVAVVTAGAVVVGCVAVLATRASHSGPPTTKNTQPVPVCYAGVCE